MITQIISLRDEDTWPQQGQRISIVRGSHQGRKAYGEKITVSRIQVASDAMYEFNKEIGKWMYQYKDDTELLVEDDDTGRWYIVQDYTLVQS